MEKMTLGITHIMNANAAINGLLHRPGLPPERVYWLDRLRKKLEPHLKKYEKERKAIVDKYAEVVPSFGFVPYYDFPAFKNEMLEAVKYGIPLTEVFDKYEKISEYKCQRGIDITKRDEFEEALTALEEALECEIEFNKIGYDAFVETALAGIPGELQLALEFAFDKETKSNIVVVQSTQGPFKI
jgi:hypothetical protein